MKAQEAAPDYIRTLLVQAYYFEIVGEPEKANTAYQRALSCYPHHPDVLNNYGTFLCKQGDYHQAQQFFLQACQQPGYPEIAKSYENAGLCAIKAHQRKQAKAFLTKALHYDPTRLRSRSLLAQLSQPQSESINLKK